MKQINIDDALYNFLEEATKNLNSMMTEEFSVQDAIESYIIQMLEEEISAGDDNVSWSTPSILKEYKDYISGSEEVEPISEKEGSTVDASTSEPIVTNPDSPDSSVEANENVEIVSEPVIDEKEDGFFSYLFDDDKDEKEEEKKEDEVKS